MRTLISVFAVALIAATAAAENICFFNATNGTQVNLNGMAAFNGTAAGYNINVSPCAKVNTSDCTNSYGTIVRGATHSCFKTAPTRSYAGNTTTFVFTSVPNTLALLMQGNAVYRMRTQYICDPTATTVTEAGSSYRQLDYQLTINFRTAAACPLVPTVAPTTPAPVAPHHDDDDNKLSTWAIVGIIAGCVVVVVIVAFVCFKFRSTESQAEGEYARV